MNTYILHMLQQAKKVHQTNKGMTGRDSKVKCPFCIADEQEQWFKICHVSGVEYCTTEVPEKATPPHCVNCPLLSITALPLQDLMDDCVVVGQFILNFLEERIYEDFLHEDFRKA